MPRRASKPAPRHPDHERIYGPQAVAKWYRIANLAAFSTYLGLVAIFPIGFGITALIRRFPSYQPQLDAVSLAFVISIGLAYLTHFIATPILLMRISPDGEAPTVPFFATLMIIPPFGLIIHAIVALSARKILTAHGYEVRMLWAHLDTSRSRLRPKLRPKD
jgi:hypothetical protein